MEEERRGAGAAQRGGDLAADDSRLAHAGEDDAAAALPQQLDGAVELPVETVDEREDRGGFRFEDLARERAAVSHARPPCGPWRCRRAPSAGAAAARAGRA